MSTNSATLAPTCRFATSTGDNEPLCHCAQVAESTVHHAVNEGGVKTLEAVVHETGAGSGCGACKCRINRVLEGLPAKCGGSFEFCHGCGSIAAICSCNAA